MQGVVPVMNYDVASLVEGGSPYQYTRQGGNARPDRGIGDHLEVSQERRITICNQCFLPTNSLSESRHQALLQLENILKCPKLALRSI